MTLLVVVGLAILTGVSGHQSRIVGGTQTSIDQYPSIVQVDFLNVFSNAWSQSCAGTLVNEKIIVSAASCFSGMFYDEGRRRIRAGSSNRNAGGILLEVADALNYPLFVEDEINHDISLVRLTDSVVYSPVVQPATIIVQDYMFPAQTPVVQAGWGLTAEDAFASPDLLQVEVQIVDPTDCAAQYLNEGWTVTDTMICTGVEDGGKGACSGDYGGPTYYDDILVGIIVSAYGCNSEYHAINTRMSAYTDWIVENAVVFGRR